MERDPTDESTGIEPDDATPNDATDAGSDAPAPFETPDEDPEPVEKTGDAGR
jgi:hypothetical protein